ncbi:MAG: cysteine--tRNA ligase [Alphaproteobacteria bacterium]|nr:MAG: cysteine--tRNA ligase [Alphaproteobacteria bacterium]
MLSLYDSKTKTKDSFSPIDPNNITMYVCGPTVYSFAHIGNARPVVVFDLLYRLLSFLYPRVTYVRNFTDVDDKIIDRLEGKTLEEYTKPYIDAFHEDMGALGAMKPDHEPKATQYIAQMISMIEGLVRKGYAYHADGHVLFCVSKYEGYGALSGMSQDELEAGARVEVASYKENPSDFVLWKPSSNDIPGWESPWGRGRPGWHIECSAMSSEFFGKTFDIHGGGIDLIFPHHENERAQSCCFHNTSYMANVWMHNGHLTMSGEKMSKSLGNIISVRELLKEYKGEVIRFAFFMTHYRQPMDFSDDLLEKAYNNLNKIYTALRRFEDIIPTNPIENFLKALQDDLNTPLALSVLYEAVSELNSAPTDEKAAAIKASLRLLGIGQFSMKEWFQNAAMSEKDILAWIEKRNAARQKKDFQESDRIRDWLLAEGVVLEDSPAGTSWRTISKNI